MKIELTDEQLRGIALRVRDYVVLCLPRQPGEPVGEEHPWAWEGFYILLQAELENYSVKQKPQVHPMDAPRFTVEGNIKQR